MRGSRLPHSRSTAINLPATDLGVESAPGQGPQGAAGVWAASQSKGGTKVLGILGQGTLTCWNPLRDALPFSQAQAGSWTRGEQGRTDCTPSGFPRSCRAAKGRRPMFSMLFLPAKGAGGHLQTALPPAPHPALPVSSPSANPKQTHRRFTAFPKPRCALYALRSAASLFPLSSRTVLSSLLLLSFCLFSRSASVADAARRLRPASCFLMFHCEELPL